MKSKLILCAAISLALTACGGGGGSSGGDTPAPVPTPKSAIQGKAIDGYIQGATVYLDLNFNKQLDAGEPNVITTDKGDYQMELTAAQEQCAEYVPLVVDVPVGAVDLDLGPVEQAYQMVLPPKFKPIVQDDFYHVTPLTSVLWSYVERELATDGALTCQSVMADQQKRESIMTELKLASERVVKHYNISEQKLYDDYIASGDAETATLAMEIVRGLQASFQETSELKAQHPDAQYAYVDYHIGDARDNDNAYPDAWYREQGIYWADRTTTELSKVSSDFTQVLRVIGRGEQVTKRGAGYSYSSSYGFESTRGDDSPYSCDSKEVIDVAVGDKIYHLVNLVNFGATEVQDCVVDNMAEVVTHRYAILDYKENGADLVSQFVYSYNGSFPFLNNWVGIRDTVSTLDMNDLVSAFEQLPYRFEDKTAEPNAQGWNKRRITKDEAGIQTEIKYDEFDHYTKTVTQVDGTYATECGTDGVVWGTCS